MREFIAKVEGGRLPRFVSEAVRALLERKGEGIVKITLEDYVAKRTNSQNRYYWKVLVGHILKRLNDINDQQLEPEHVHEFIKNKICPDLCEARKEIILMDGEILTLTIFSTKHLTTEQHSEMAERVRMWAAENGVDLPLPNEAQDEAAG